MITVKIRAARLSQPTPSPCNQGEGKGGGFERTLNAERRTLKDPLPTPPQFDSAHYRPEYKGRELSLMSSAFSVQNSAFTNNPLPIPPPEYKGRERIIMQ
jgi:hypothetical protein